MSLARTAEALLRIQSAAQMARRELVNVVPIPESMELIRRVEELETLLAQSIARRLGAEPMALGGLISQPTFALLGESGPEMVVPVSPGSRKKRKVSKYQKEFGRQLKKVKKDATLKNGSMRKGMTQEKLFAKAHRLTRKALK